METIFTAILLGSLGMSDAPSQEPPTSRLMQVAGTCFLDGDEEDGMNKICFYSCTSGTKAITVRRSQTCPITIND